MRTVWVALVLLACLGAVGALTVVGCGGAAGGPTDGDTIAPPDELGTGTITGSVVDASDTSLAIGNAYVHVPRAGVASAHSPAYLRAVNYAQGYSAEDGSYRLESLPAGRLTMVVDPPADSGYSGLTIELDVAEGANVSIRVTLARADLAEQITAITVDPPNVTVPPGATQQYTATVVGAGGATLDLAPIWMTTGGAGAIDENGLFTAGTAETNGTILAVVATYSGSTTVVVERDNAPPAVALSVAPTSGVPPLDVTAAATAIDSDGTIASVDLDWGDGSAHYTGTSFPANQAHTYSAVGSYTVTALATDDGGATGSATSVVQVSAVPNDPPTCSLSVSAASGETPLAVTFGGSGSDPDGTIVSWTLDYGDGSAFWTGSSAPSGLAHTYDSSGTYVSRLTVVDDGGASGSAVQTVTAYNPGCLPPSASLTASPTSGAAPLTVSFSGTGADTNAGGAIAEYRLDFQGDGTDDWTSGSPPAGVSYVYAGAGTYAPKLTVVNACGAPGSASQTVQVTQAPALSVSPTSLDFGLTDTSKTFSIANAGGGTLNWSVTENSSWITGVTPASGSNAGTVTVTVGRTGLSAGTHSASISVNSNGGTQTVTVSVTVQESSPVLSVTPTSLDFGETTTSMGFAISNTGGGTLSWSVSESESWITSVSPASGAGAGTVTVTVSRGGLSAGTHAGSVAITSSGGNSQVSASITVVELLAFASDRTDGLASIYTMNLDGTSPKRLSTPPAGYHDYGPRWSPDGTKVAFWRYGSSFAAVYVVSRDGGPLTQCPSSGSIMESRPAWSPDGAMLAVSVAAGLAKVPSNGSGSTTALGVSGYGCDWSPDGTKLVYAYDDPSDPGTTHINTAAADGTNVQRLVTAPSGTGATYHYPRWSPDGSKVAFAGGETSSADDDIMVVNSDGSGLAVLAGNSPTAEDLQPSWSPDGSMLVWRSNRDGDYEIYRMNADGTGVAQLTNNSFWDGDPVWWRSP